MAAGRKNVNVADLEFAALWLGAFEDDNGVPASESNSDQEEIEILHRVIAWIEKEIDKREAKKNAR